MRNASVSLIIALVAPSLVGFASLAGRPIDADRSGDLESKNPGNHESAAGDVPAEWWTSVQGSIRDTEYQITWKDATVLTDLPAGWHAPNRAHNFRTYFATRGIRVVPRTEETPPWEWGLALRGYGRGDLVRTVAEASVRPVGNRIEYARGRIVEWYENAPRGLEEGFTLASRPEESFGDAVEAFENTAPPRGPQADLLDAARSDRAVFVQLALTGTLGPAFSTDGQAIDFRTPGGVNVVHFAALRVRDARGRELPAWMEGFAAIGARTIRIVFDDTDAAYPVTIDPVATSPAWTGESHQASAYFGISVATAGDVNGDGYSDVIVGAPYYDNGQTNEGRAFVYLGSASGLASTPAWTAESDQASAYFGWSAATAGDVDEDGYSDVIVGAYQYDNGQTNEGRAYVYLGSASGLASSPAWTAESDQATAGFGYSVATAGDVNGDGYSDVIVGAFLYSNGQAHEGRASVYLGSPSGLSSSPAWSAESDQANAHFGASVATAGDVNGDGYSDVIVGAELYDNGQTDEGRAYVYLGSASGLSSTPAWTAESDQATADFGISVAPAGDVNGDGYSDVIVGAYQYDNGETDEGRAYVYLGSPSGLASTPAWTAESDQASAGFGFSVATAGDVNGDGYSDVIVGAPYYDNGEAEEGRAFVYLGSASGLASSPAWMAESDRAFAYFGWSAATAGDVNGDGYSDVIVGAPYYDNGQTNEGRAYVYLGSASGLASTPAWTAESDMANAYFGRSVATAGDANGDGYSDVIVGAPSYANGQSNEGRAFVYLGSASGLASTPAWTAESDMANAYFGSSVATAGDANGDGYSDVIVGADSYTNGQAGEGRAFVYYGNGGLGPALRPQQRRSDDSAPIAPLGASDAFDSFRLAARGRTPFGRGNVKLEWEVKPLGTPFDGTGAQAGASWMDTGTAGAALDELATSLTPQTLYHWRVRLRYHLATSPFQHRSRWLTVPWNGWQEADLRTLAPATPAGRVPDGATGTALQVTRSGGADINLTWGPSCLAADTDYGIYEGSLGAFYSHTSRFCSTDGATTTTFTPNAGSTYYLVVPRNASWEGSYGTDSAGVERPPAAAACLPQLIGTCP